MMASYSWLGMNGVPRRLSGTVLIAGLLAGVSPQLVAAQSNRGAVVESAQSKAPRLAAAQDVEALESIPRTDDLLAPLDDATARRLLAELQLLVLPQQKERAKELIQQYPNTRLAELAQKLIDQYDLYTASRARQRRLETEHSLRIRAYWDARRPVHRPFVPPQVRITNRSDEPLLYQVKTYETEWLGPYRLRVGATDTFNSCLILRRLTKQGTQMHTLWPGTNYVFVKLTPEAEPQLFKNERKELP